MRPWNDPNKLFGQPNQFDAVTVDDLEGFNYESPIKAIETKMQFEFEGELMRAVKSLGFDVDKDELLRWTEVLKMASLIDVKDCPCDGCEAKPCGHPARCIKFALWLNKTVNAVEVVRCKDCQHFEKKWSYHNTPSEDVGCGYCWHWEYETGMSPNQVVGDDFCSYGERRNNETD